jgi:hypothetical protein
MTGVNLSAIVLLAAIAPLAFAQKPPATAAQRMRAHFDEGNRQILEMAQDFPESKYDFRLTKEMRSFGEVIVHVMSGNVYGAKAGRGEKAKWDELDAKNYRTKAQIVAAFQKSVADCAATLKDYPEGFNKNLEPWMSIMEHSAEHYGLLVAYYRASGLVPPASRPKSK